MTFLLIAYILGFHLYLGTLLIWNAMWGTYSHLLRSKVLVVAIAIGLPISMFLTLLTTDNMSKLNYMAFTALTWFIPYGIAWLVMRKQNDEHPSLPHKLLQTLAGAIFIISSLIVIFVLGIFIIVFWNLD